ncbi:MAG: hypothetical protein SPI72_06095 [Porphyromonas sp.]|nr:hypothetical protein [Porphyromonas sp.]
MKKLACSLLTLSVALLSVTSCKDDSPKPRPGNIPAEISSTATKTVELVGNNSASDFLEIKLEDFKEVAAIGKQNYGWIERASVDISSGSTREFYLVIPSGVELSDVQFTCADQQVKIDKISKSGPVRISSVASDEIRFYETILNEVARTGAAKISYSMNLSKPMITESGKLKISLPAIFKMRDQMK